MPYDKYQRLSYKTFFITLLQNSLLAITVSILWIGLVLIKTSDIESFLSFLNSQEIISATLGILDLAIVIGLFFVIFSWVILILRVLIRHMIFYYMLSDQGISTKQGLIHKEETTTPYRHIENVNISQSLLYQLLGMCKLEIITGGEEDTIHSHTSEIEFPVIEKELAEEIKKEIFSRTNTQVVSDVNKR